MNTREAKYKLKVAQTLLGTGMVQPMRPDKVVRTLTALRRWGPTPAASCTVMSIRYPEREALVDERGTLTFAEVERRTNALARVLAKAGVGEAGQRRDHVSQPPWVHRRDDGLLEVGGGCAVFEHGVRGSADRGRDAP